MGVFGIFSKYPILCGYLHPLGCVSKYCFCVHLVVNSIGYVVVYSLFSAGACLEEKFVKQNGLFEEFFYSNVSHNTMVTVRENNSEKDPIVGSQF